MIKQSQGLYHFIF